MSFVAPDGDAPDDEEALSSSSTDDTFVHVLVSSFSGKIIKLQVEKRAGKESEDVLESESDSAASDDDDKEEGRRRLCAQLPVHNSAQYNICVHRTCALKIGFSHFGRRPVRTGKVGGSKFHSSPLAL